MEIRVTKMIIKIIKNDEDYRNAIRIVGELMDREPKPNTSDAEKLELLAALIQDYEESIYTENLPDPIDSLIFRMEQQNLSADDLIPYIGSRSKVSEVLSKKRPLSLNMIKALHSGLGIPAKVLLNQRDVIADTGDVYDRFPIKEMLRRGYLGLVNNVSSDSLKEKLDSFFSVISPSEGVPALLSRTHYIRSPKPMNSHYLFTWATQVVHKAHQVKNVPQFNPKAIDKDFLKSLIDLSDEENGVLKAIDFLKNHGIIVIIEPHFSYTYLDGAAITLKDFNPIIGMTIRHDRLDNFWFTLVHELSHIILHSNSGVAFFYDNVESIDLNDSREVEADNLAIEMMVPENEWRNSPASILPSIDAAKKLAAKLSIHPAIVAGRMRYKNKYFSFLNSIIGQGEVRKLFPNILWRVSK